MERTLNETRTAALLEALGLPADTNDPDLVAATATDLAAQVQALDPAKPSTIAAAAKRNGMEVIDTDTAAALRRDAQEGRRIAAAAARERIEAAVDDAISKGKVMASRRKHWVTLIEADPGMAEVLAATPNETAVPLSEIGHAADNTGDLAQPAGWFY
ncbi:hypothetical protein [Mycolicibacterium helvum]|nr:hypothetical protein [Mycolicibacterium helvum]